MQRQVRSRGLIGMDFVRYILPHWLAGCGGGIVAAVALVATNTGGLRDLIWHTDGGLAFALLILGCVVTFGSVAIGYGIMRIGDKDPR